MHCTRLLLRLLVKTRWKPGTATISSSRSTPAASLPLPVQLSAGTQTAISLSVSAMQTIQYAALVKGHRVIQVGG